MDFRFELLLGLPPITRSGPPIEAVSIYFSLFSEQTRAIALNKTRRWGIEKFEFTNHVLIDHEYSFAHATMSTRLPTILGKAIDDVVVTLNTEYEEEKVVDLLACIERMEDLMDDLQGNAILRPIIDDGEGDIPLWNKV